MPEIYGAEGSMFDTESRLVGEYRESVGLSVAYDAFYDSALDVMAALGTARPAVRKSYLELILDDPTMDIWDPESGFDVQHFVSPEDGVVSPGEGIASAFLLYQVARQDYLTEKEEITADPDDLRALQSGVAACEAVLRSDTLQKYMKGGNAQKVDQTITDILELKERVDAVTEVSSGYEIGLLRSGLSEILARAHFHSADVFTKGYGPIAETPLADRVLQAGEAFGIDASHMYSKVVTAVLNSGKTIGLQVDKIDLSSVEGEDLFTTYRKRIAYQEAQKIEQYYVDLHNYDPEDLFSPKQPPTSEQMHERLKIIGDIPERFDPESQYEFLQTLLPIMSLADVRQITFSAPSTVDHWMSYDGKREAATYAGGVHHRNRGTSEIWVNNTCADKDRMMTIVAHEVAHGFEKVIHPRYLVRFCDITVEEPVSITEYVTELKQRGVKNIVQEDFAEAFAMYHVDPEKLKELAPLRFALMEDIMAFYQERLPSVASESVAA